MHTFALLSLFNHQTMKNQRILVPIDFTPATDHALEFAVIAAKRISAGIRLLHVEDKKLTSETQDKLALQAGQVSGEHRIDCDYVFRQGSIFTEIPKEAGDPDYRFMVIGSHGFKGIREKLMGPDILKLVKEIPVPAIVLQKHFAISGDGLKTIVFPAGTHKTFPANIHATVMISKLFDAEVHLYTVQKEGQDWSDELKRNIDLAKSEFEKNQVRYQRVNQSQTTYSLGYSKQILKYAVEVNADLIAVMSVPTPEHYYFADADKEMLLTNEAAIPILCTSGKQAV